MLQNLLKGYYAIIILSFAIIVISIISLLYIQFSDKITRERAVIHRQFQENSKELNQFVSTVNSYLRSMESVVTIRLSHYETYPEHPWLSYLKNDPTNTYFHLDSLPLSLATPSRINLTANKSLETLTEKERKQLSVLLEVAPILQTAYHDSPHITWSYFLSRDFLMMYPWVSSEEFRISNQVVQGTYAKYERIFASRFYENTIVWSQPYEDSAGKGKIISALMPIYHRSQYIGAFIFDITLESMKKMVTYVPEQLGSIYLLHQEKTLLARTSGIQTHEEQQRAEQVIGVFTEYEMETFQEIDDTFFYYEALPNTSWYLLYIVPKSDFYFSAFSDVGIYLIGLLVIMVTIQGFTFLFTQYRFLVPAKKLLQHIQYESRHIKDKNAPRIKHSKLPKGWSLWFHVITGIFEENRSMIQDMRQANANLEKKVRQRTIEIQTKQEEILVQNEELRQQQEEIEAQRDKIEQQKNSILEKNALMRQYNDALLQLVKSRGVQLGFWGKAMREITETTAKELDVARVGIWQYDHKRNRIQCMNLYTQQNNSHTEGGVLYQSEYPHYFEEINAERMIISKDVTQNPALSQVYANYLQPYGVQSRLDVPFFVEGKLGGVLTCETQGNLRNWSAEALAFAKSIADIITISYKTMRRRIAEEKVKTQQTEILARNAELKQKQAEIEKQTLQLTKQNEMLDQKNQTLEHTLEQLKTTQSQLVHSEKMASLGVLTAGIAHEINNPINYIKSGALGVQKAIRAIMRVVSLYEEITPENSATKLQEIEDLKQKMRFTQIVQQAERVSSNIEMGVERTAELVKELRTFSRMDAATLDKFQIHDGIESTLLLLTNQYKYNITIQKEYGNIPPIECYPGKLNQVFMNILTNAIQAIKEKEGTITIKTALDDAKECVRISIKDTGSGMPETVRNRIFEPFFTTKDVGEGTGLGLAISMSIVEDHRGRIDVFSQEGKGTEFVITLPRTQQMISKTNAPTV